MHERVCGGVKLGDAEGVAEGMASVPSAQRSSVLQSWLRLQSAYPKHTGPPA